MKIEERLSQMLEENGIWPKDVPTIIEMAKAHPLFNTDTYMAKVWGEEETVYPKPILSVMWLSLKSVALEWIDKNKPQAWYRPMFAE